MTAKKVRKRLQKALETGERLYVKRAFDAWKTYGFVVGLSDEWVLIHKVVDCRFNGWVALRRADITSVGADTGFVGRLLEKRGQSPKAQPELDLTDIVSLLRTAHAAAPIVDIELEKREPNVCYIGRIDKVGKRKVKLNEIDTRARWRSNRSFPLKHITQISLGNDYCEGLWEMGRESAPFSLLEP